MRPTAVRRLLPPVAAAALVLALGIAPAHAAGIVVDSLTDGSPGPGCTLRDAITSANTDTATGDCPAGSGADLITFSVAGTIVLGGGLPQVTSDLTIDGGGAISVDGFLLYRPFDIAGTVTLDRLTISHGESVQGGAVRNVGTLTISRSTITGNHSADSGGGIYNGGSLSVTNSTISGNASVGSGAGIWDADYSTATVRNSTISGNVAGSGTAVAGLTLVVVRLANTIIAGNTGGDVGVPLSVDTGNLVGIPSGMTLGDILVVDGGGNPVLADNGGPTSTIALALIAGNPAIDTGDAPTCAAAPVGGLDQRGLARPAACDIGAYEAQDPSLPSLDDIRVAADGPTGSVVTWTDPPGSDEQGGSLAVACAPASGSTFAAGTSTTVTCATTDAAGHGASSSFAVIVGAAAAPAPSVRVTVPPTDGLADRGRDALPAPGLPLALGLLSLLVALILARTARRPE